jgi:predicted nucleotide-binding protein
MDDVLDDLVRTARRCERAARALDAEPVASMIERLRVEAANVGKAASGGWLGYHARIYTEGLRPKSPSDYFDTEWGSEGAFSSRTQGGPWAIYDYEAVLDEIRNRADAADTAIVETATKTIESVFEACRAELLPTIDVLLATQPDEAVKAVRDKIAKLRAFHSEHDYFDALTAGKQFRSRDNRALAEGIVAPPHVKIELWITSQVSRQKAIQELAKHADYLAKYIEKGRKLKGKSIAKTDGKVFIGHGRSSVWQDLKNFLQDRLGLTWDEFNRESVAGLSTKERLESMLDEASFAFIVMTAEDEHADKSRHARSNVIHEAGLFQGRLGFKRAIVLLEDGCEDFSNIEGLGQIRFPPGDISCKREEIRLVLEREKII